MSQLSAHYPSGTPLLAVSEAAAALDFYRVAFDAQTLVELSAPGGRMMHAAIAIFGAPVIVVDDMPEVELYSPNYHGGSSVSVILDCPDADAAYRRAVSAGATGLAAVREDFSGSRHGLLRCPFGHRWIPTTRTVELSFDQIRDRFETWLGIG